MPELEVSRKMNPILCVLYSCLSFVQSYGDLISCFVPESSNEDSDGDYDMQGDEHVSNLHLSSRLLSKASYQLEGENNKLPWKPI